MKNIEIVMNWLFLFVIVIFLTSGCRVQTKKKRAEIDHKLDYFEMKFDMLDRKIDAFNPIVLPLDYAMSRSEEINNEADTLKTEFDAYESVLFGEDLFAKKPIATMEQRDRYMSLIDRQIGLVDRLEDITLALHTKVNLIR